MRKTSLSVKLPLLFIASTLALMLVVVIAVHVRFNNRMIAEYDRMAHGVTQLMADRIDGDKVDEYIEKNFDDPEYNDIHDYFITLKENYPDVLYLYAYRCEEDGGHMIFDLDNEEVENGEAYEPGYVYEIEAPFDSHKDEMMAGKQVPGYKVESEEDGHLYSYGCPVFDSKGNYACTVAVDFSLDQMIAEDNAFTMRLALIILAISALILIAEVEIVKRWITKPLNAMSGCVGKFEYETEEDRGNNIDRVDDLDIRSKDEVGDIYQALRTMTRDSFLSTAHLTLARKDILDKEERISAISQDAYRDSLTKVGSAAALKRDMAGPEIADADQLAIVMLDVNDLKYINDSFGHDKGDLYIQGCCRMACNKFKHSPVYRIGGDEFIVILKGDDMTERERLLQELRHEYAESYANGEAEPWERYSASLGMAEGDDMNVLFKQADKEMYKEKEDFHRISGHMR